MDEEDPTLCQGLRVDIEPFIRHDMKRYIFTIKLSETTKIVDLLI